MAADTLIRAGSGFLGLDTAGAPITTGPVCMRVEAGRIAEIGAPEALIAAHPGLTVHGEAHHVAMPGLVNSHHHSGLTPIMLGMPFAPLELWLPQFRGVRGVGDRLDTLYAAIEMLESGTTSVHHLHGGLFGAPEGWADTADAVLGAYAEAGMRSGFAVMLYDQNILAYDPDPQVLADLPGDVAAWIAPQLAAETAPIGTYLQFFHDLRARWAARAPETVRINLAPANLHWCSDRLLQEVADTARGCGCAVHLHLLETRRQADYGRRRSGRTAVRHLADLGVLGPWLTVGHCNWAGEDELDLLAGHGCTVCHNASSGLRLGSGIAPVNAMRARGVPLALGIDQSNLNDDRDMTLEMRLVWALHRGTGLVPHGPTAAEVLHAATAAGARTLGFEGVIGRLAPGQGADVVLLDAHRIARPHIDPRTPLADALLHRGTRDAVDEVFVAGRRVVQGGRVTTIDRDAILAEIGDRLSRPLTPAEAANRAMTDRLTAALTARALRDAGPTHLHSDLRNAIVPGSRPSDA
jgi:cytosine/adenosine deaminase-related metal-dependent hydrolase